MNSVMGNSFMLSAYGSNFGSMFIILNDFDERRSPDLTADAIMATLRKRFRTEVPDALVNVFPPPAVSGLGCAGGFKLMVEDRGDLGLVELQRQTDNMVGQREPDARARRVCSQFTRPNSPQLFVDVDRAKPACSKESA